MLTTVGKQVLLENPAKIDNTYLQRFESFRNVVSADHSEENEGLSTPTVSSQTPQDVLDDAFRKINQTLCDDLLAEIVKQSPVFFEHLVIKLLTHMGYGGTVEHAGTLIGQSGDEGIDGIIRKDKLGFNLIYIQAAYPQKQHIESNVSTPISSLMILTDFLILNIFARSDSRR